MFFTLSDSDGFTSLRERRFDTVAAYTARCGLLEAGLLADYDQLLCLGQLHAIEKHWYQIETARKVLRQLAGRAILADEVGLGKTIEAGLIASEYFARGMIASLLVLTPASLVSQWQEELAQKFQISTVTTDDQRVAARSRDFWHGNERIVASLNTAKSSRQAEYVVERAWDLVIIDEAHHLRNRKTLSWQFVNALKMRFVLMLTATPLQNSLLELYNLLTLLKPGLFQTESQFRAEYVDPKNPTKPRNPERLRRLMREVMVRNTRSLIDVELPKRFATTIKVEPSPQERAISTQVAEFIRAHDGKIDRFTKTHLLTRAGSSLAAMHAAIETLKKHSFAQELLSELREIKPEMISEKARRLLDLLRKSTQKTIVFSNYQATSAYLAQLLTKERISFRTFTGGMSLKEKDESIEAFRSEVSVLLASETAGEGRNIQFATTIVNYDLPWNPMQIEQRIGRVHRIGQTEEVYVFNFCLAGSIEEYMLRVLHEKINMFELVVGEIDTILGNLDEDLQFSEVIMDLWLQNQTAHERDVAFDALAQSLLEAKAEYDEAKAFDEAIFGSDFEAG